MGKSKQKSLHLCSACGFRQATPTGKNYEVAQQEIWLNNHHVNVSDKMLETDYTLGPTALPVPPINPVIQDSLEISQQLDKLKNIVLQS